VALHNAIVLDCYNFNIDLAIQAQKNSPVIYGSEFRHISELSKLLNRHPRWSHTSKIIKEGASFPLLPIPDDIRKTDLILHKERGNHKSAQKQAEALN
jgi:hypothetical protein